MRNISNPDSPGEREGESGDSTLTSDVLALGEILRTLGRLQPIRDPLHTALEEMKINPAQMHALLWLGSDGDLKMGELARRLGITEKTVTGLVDRLEKERFCQRVRDQHDRRQVHVQLTARGANTYKKLQALIREKMARVLSLLDASDRRELIQIFKKLIDRMGAIAHPPAGNEEAK